MVKILKYKLFLRLIKFFGFYKHKPQIGMRSLISSDSTIGDYTYIGNNCNITKSKIGRYCSIANNVSIGPGEHDLSKVSTSSLFYIKPYEILTSKGCEIGNDVWIGVNCVIRRGVSVGNGAIIGANSFVNDDVPDFAIVAGSPAKIIRMRFNEEKIKLIYESQWWNLKYDDAKSTLVEIEKS